MKYLFVDTNIFLRLYSVGTDYPDLITKLIKKIEKKEIKLFLTQQVIDEFNRNREIKLRDSLKIIKEIKEIKFSIPSFCRNIKSINAIKKRFDEIRSFAKKAHANIKEKALKESLQADIIFRKLFKTAKIINISPGVIDKAKERFSLGNPPGKKNSYGDAINWTVLLEEVPSSVDLYLITADRDYTSEIDNNYLNSFLKREWKKKKNSSVIVYNSLSRFLKEEFSQAKITVKQVEEEESTPVYDTNSCSSALVGVPAWTGSSNMWSTGSPVASGSAIIPLAGSSSSFISNEKEITCHFCNKIFYSKETWSHKCPYCNNNILEY